MLCTVHHPAGPLPLPRDRYFISTPMLDDDITPTAIQKMGAGRTLRTLRRSGLAWGANSASYRLAQSRFPAGASRSRHILIAGGEIASGMGSPNGAPWVRGSRWSKSSLVRVPEVRAVIFDDLYGGLRLVLSDLSRLWATPTWMRRAMRAPSGPAVLGSRRTRPFEPRIRDIRKSGFRLASN
ncbi:hypothetical protein VUR80DRAFT_4852 [Thermomyces stellatus]